MGASPKTLFQQPAKLIHRRGGVPMLVRRLMDVMSAEARKAKVPGLFTNSLAGSMVAACRSPMAQRLAVHFGDQDFPATGTTEGSGQMPFAIAQWLSAALDGYL